MKEPRIDFKDLFAALFFSIGLIIILTILHLLRIGTVGYTYEVINTIFNVFLTTFIGLGFIAVSFLIIHLLKWLVWTTTTPNWLKCKNEK
jgi:hypothetical protein